MTWTRYIASPTGRHVCTGCGQKFRVILTASSVVLLLGVSVAAAGMPSVIAFFFGIDFWYTIAAYVVIIFGVVIPFDRWLDNQFRPTKPVP